MLVKNGVKFSYSYFAMIFFQKIGSNVNLFFNTVVEYYDYYVDFPLSAS